MGYSQSLEAAGAKVIAYNEFGSYQGDWAALVEFKDETGFVFGSFGSCSGCDAFEAEFSYGEAPEEKDGKYYDGYYDEITKEEYDEKLTAYNQRLADFGAGYLINLADRNIVETRLANLIKDDWFSDEEKSMLEWCISEFDKLN